MSETEIQPATETISPIVLGSGEQLVDKKRSDHILILPVPGESPEEEARRLKKVLDDFARLGQVEIDPSILTGKKTGDKEKND